MKLVQYIAETLDNEVLRAEVAWQDDGPVWRWYTAHGLGWRIGRAVADAYEAYDEYQELLAQKKPSPVKITEKC